MSLTTIDVADRPVNQKPSMAIAGDTGKVYLVAREYPNGVTSEYNIVLYVREHGETSFTKSILHNYTTS